MKQCIVNIFFVWLVASFILFFNDSRAQEAFFFTEGSDLTYYDQGIVDIANLVESTFEHTHPPAAPEYNDKVPCSTTAFKGQTSLKFNYFSSDNGSWKATIYRSGWTSANISSLDSISFYIFSENELPKAALPLIGLRTVDKNASGDVDSKLYSLADYNEVIPSGQWVQIKFPLSVITEDNENCEMDFSSAKAIIFAQSEDNNTSRSILIDQIKAFKSFAEIPVAVGFSGIGYDSHADLSWQHPVENLSYRIYASFDGGQTFEERSETNADFFLDFVPETARNSSVTYRISTVLESQESDFAETTVTIRDFSDDELLDMIQYYSFLYFWDGAHQTTGMALERSNGSGRTAASGATGMGLMALIVAHERKYKPQSEIKDRVLMILEFLENCERHHGVWSHWYNADTYQTQPFSSDDDGGDLVETSFLAQGLIALKNYFSGTDSKSVQIREKADQLWKEVDWSWYRQEGQNVLYWHWSPNVGFQKNMKIAGWNEALVTYVMAASSPTHSIPKEVYEQGWAKNGNIVNNRTFYNYEIKLAPDWGGPLFFIHYSHLGINSHELKDQYADYWTEYVNTALIHHAYSVDNPGAFENYGPDNWGLTASDDPFGYTAHRPVNNDNGTISPTAALASMPYTPEKSLQALKYFYRERGSELFGKYGPYDAFNDQENWVQEAYIGIDQGPIVVMIENYRTGLLWNQVMKDSDVQAGLDKLGFEYQVVTSSGALTEIGSFRIYPNPASDKVYIDLGKMERDNAVSVEIFSMDGRLVEATIFNEGSNSILYDCSAIKSGLYLFRVETEENCFIRKLMIQK
ncbi:glucoamylase family protein [uncultured Sunxiuqinia sp.]|uniref:glucoamylase family protein n=1 Tax=uncultured Sunxiuqinia sp. TaxID=1573825 RepID=UPI002AA84D5A|nr:glucoamylase family protein [uncultured Sunxiuqinia sp.]